MYGLGGSNLAIGISLIMRDRFSGGARTAAATLGQLNQQALNAARQQMDMQRNVNAVGAGIGIGAIVGMREFVKVGAEFDKQMTYLYSISAGKHTRSLSEMKTKAMEVGVSTMFSTTDIADAMTHMAQAGQTTEQIYNNIYSVAVLAAATMSGVEASASTMNDIMIGFNIPASEANATRVSDIITKTINDSNIKLADFSESMKYIIPSATSLGVSLEEVASMIGVVGNAGIRGSMAGTNLENFLRYAARAAGKEGKGKQQGALAMLGLSPKDLINSKGQLMSVAEMVPMIGMQLQKMEKYDIKGFNAMMDIFGVRGGRTANLLVNRMAEYKTALDGVNNSQGVANKTATDVMGSLWGSSEQLQSTWENFKIVFTEAITPVLQPIIKGLTFLADILRKVVQTPLGKFLTILAAGFIVIKTAIMGYRAIVLSLRLLHMDMGTSFTRGSSQVVSGYGRMTAAANAYRASATAAGGVGAMMMGGGVTGSGKYGKQLAKKGIGTYSGMTPGGSQYVIGQGGTSKFVPKGSTPLGWVPGRGSGLSKFSNFAGKASLPAMIGGMALTLGSEATRDKETGELSTAGKTMSVAGSAVSWAGTGAMLGSVVPGIGTGVGAIVGGVGGLLYGLYDNLSDVSEEVNNVKKPEGEEFDADAWRRKVAVMNKLGDAEFMYGKGWTPDVTYMDPTNQRGAATWLANKGRETPIENRITINIDGKQAMAKVVDDRQAELLINLAAF